MKKYTSVDRVFAKIARDLGDESIVENDVIEWAGEALEAIGTVAIQEEALAFIEVENHQVKIPAGAHSIIQIARNHCWSKQPKARDILCPKIIKDNCCTTLPAPLTTPADHKPTIPVALDCNGTPVNAYDLAYYRPYFDLRAEYYIWSNCNYYHQCYSPVRLSTSTFFDSVLSTENSSAQLHEEDNEKYKIVLGEFIRFGFKEGSVAIAYNRTVVDEETGYPMIPDTYSHVEAITRYIKMKILERQCFNGREGSCGKAEKASMDWQWYCGQAGALDMMPKGVDEYQNLLDQRSYILPRNNRYFSFFGKLATPEDRKWNDPDRRNINRMYFRGY